MHDAYDYKPVLEKLPLQIEAIACYGNADTKCSCRILLFIFVTVAVFKVIAINGFFIYEVVRDMAAVYDTACISHTSDERHLKDADLSYNEFQRSLKTFLFGQWGHGAV